MDSIGEELLKHGYIVRSYIGMGGSSDVFLAFDKSMSNRFAVKVLKINNEKERKSIINEVEIMKKLDHPNVVKYYDCIVFMNHVAIVMEYMTEGDLISYFDRFHYANSDGSLVPNERSLIQNDKVLFNIFYDLVKTIKYLHQEMNIVHRDLKPENIMLTINDAEFPNLHQKTRPKALIPKLIDFGMSKAFKDNNMLLSTRCGSPIFVAPEIIAANDKSQYDEKVDVWSLGIMLYLFSTGFFPFEDESINNLFYKIVNSPLIFKTTAEYNVPTQLKDLISKMLQKDPKKRITIDQILEHPWMKYTQTKTAKSVVSRHIIGKSIPITKSVIRTSYPKYEACKTPTNPIARHQMNFLNLYNKKVNQPTCKKLQKSDSSPISKSQTSKAPLFILPKKCIEAIAL